MSALYRTDTHRSSWESTTSTTCYKYPTAYYEAKSYQPQPLPSPQGQSQGVLKKIRKGICGVFASRRGLPTPTNLKYAHTNANDSVDSLAYAQSVDSVIEAQSIDEDNIAWGPPTRPTRRPKATKKKKTKNVREFDAESIDEDNVAWGRPTKHPKSKSKENRNARDLGSGSGSIPTSTMSNNKKRCTKKEASLNSNSNSNAIPIAVLIPNTPDSKQASCRPW